MAEQQTSALITGDNLHVTYNTQKVLQGATLTISENDRIGMVGRNGCGKSTFLRILSGEQNPDEGQVTRRRELITGFLPQEFALDIDKNVSENIRSGAKHVLDLIDEFEKLPAQSNRHDELEHRIQTLNGWSLDHRIEIAMTHLAVPAGDRTIDSLSGGEKRRVALCRAIISRPDLLILDEPTNHLDNESIAWVEDFLKNYKGAFLLVTHDRHFLDRVTTGMVELANGQFYSYKGNYTQYLVARAERMASEETVERKRQAFIRRELDWVRRSPSARRTKSKSRLDRFNEVAGQEGPELDQDIDLVVPPPPPLGNRIVDLTSIGIAVGGTTLVRGLDFKFEASMKIGVIGRNGVGKTSLLKTIMGEIKPATGTIKTGQLIKFNYVDQSRLLLNDEHTALEELSDGTEYVMFGQDRLSLRGYMKRFLFTDERITTKVKFLSGGERSRLLLAKILKRGGNFIILDEPTNDLDLATLRVLEEALIAFTGVVVVVSHDRYFLNRVSTGILAFEDGAKVHYSVGDYDYYLEKKEERARAASGTAAAVAPKPKPNEKRKRPRRLSFNEQRELSGMEEKITAVEGEIARIEELFVDPDFNRKFGQQTNELTTKLEESKQELAKLYSRWEELESIPK